MIIFSGVLHVICTIKKHKTHQYYNTNKHITARHKHITQQTFSLSNKTYTINNTAVCHHTKISDPK